jgi:hypothetical protein
VLCFELLFQFKQLYQDNYKKCGEGLLYVHTISAHFGEWYEHDDFRNSSTESGEGFFPVLKTILLRFTNHTKTDPWTLIEIALRLEYNKQVKIHVGEQVSDTRKNSVVCNTILFHILTEID